MLYPELEKDQTIKDWLTSVSKRAGTRRLYIFAMQYYTEFTKMTPEELLREAEADIDNGVRPRESRLKRHLYDYKEKLDKLVDSEELAPLTAKSRMANVLSFYKKNDIPLPSMPKNETKPKPLLQHKDIPEKKDIQEILKHCDELERAVVLIGVSSGLAVKEISNLRVRDFRKGHDKKTGVTVLELRREKENFDFVTYLSPEASNAVLAYLQLRERIPKVELDGNTKSGKRQKMRLEKQKIYSNNDYLLIRRKVPDAFLTAHKEKLRQLTETGISDIYRQLSEKAHKTTPKGCWGLIRSHNMRKYFKSTLQNKEVDSFIVEFWMGHSQDDTKSAYFRADARGGLKDIYMKYMSLLTIADEYDPEKDPSFQKLKEENKALSIVVENTSYESKTAKNEAENAKNEVEKAKTELEKTQQELKKSQQKSEEKLKKAQQEAHNEYMAIQADRELENEFRDHKIEEMQIQMNELKQMLLSGVQERTAKNMINKRPVKLTPEDEKAASDIADELLK